MRTLNNLFTLLVILLTIVSCSHVKAPQIDSEIIGTDKHLIKYDNGIILDKKTGLMWASYDNGMQISWYAAKQYRVDFALGGYDDWRLPSIEELQTLYKINQSNDEGCCISKLFKISGETLASNAFLGRCRGLSRKQKWVYTYNYSWGLKDCAFPNITGAYQRVLPVRSSK